MDTTGKKGKQEVSVQDPPTIKPRLEVNFHGRWSPEDTARIQDAIIDAIPDLDMKPSPRVELDFEGITD